jgi:hypothetical protein
MLPCFQIRKRLLPTLPIHHSAPQQIFLCHDPELDPQQEQQQLTAAASLSPGTCIGQCALAINRYRLPIGPSKRASVTEPAVGFKAITRLTAKLTTNMYAILNSITL